MLRKIVTNTLDNSNKLRFWQSLPSTSSNVASLSPSTPMLSSLSLIQQQNNKSSCRFMSSTTTTTTTNPTTVQEDEYDNGDIYDDDMNDYNNNSSGIDKYTASVSEDDMPYIHLIRRREKARYRHQSSGTHTEYLNKQPKFKSPRKRANIIYKAIQDEKWEENVKNNPNVFNVDNKFKYVDFRVGDAIQVNMVETGGINEMKNIEKIRGVVLSHECPKSINSSIHLADVVMGEQVFRKIPLHSPLIKSIEILERNFAGKSIGGGQKKKLKKSKLYYLRDYPQATRVSKR